MFKSNRNYILYLEDILYECENIKKFTNNITFDEFTNNLEKVYAVAKCFENIGEAIKNIPKEILNKYPNIPWSEISKMRDVLTHHYFGLDDEILWTTIQKDLDIFCEIVKKLEEDIKNEQ